MTIVFFGNTLGGMSDEDKKRLSAMLKRIQGQVAGIERMVSSDRDCESILTQLSASMSSLKTVARGILAMEATKCAESSGERDRYATLLKRFF